MLVYITDLRVGPSYDLSFLNNNILDVWAIPRQTIVITKNVSEQELWVGGRERKISRQKYHTKQISR